jgi:ribulose-phosphate 3-epimerase
MKKKTEIKVAPSILSGDFGMLAEEARRIERAGADAIHIDIMDGHFVPNLTLGPRAVAAINRATSLYLDVHIMIYNPFDYIERFVASGADCITFHFEATEEVEETLAYIRSCGIHAGLAFSPETSETFIPKYLMKCDKILIMTVDPGFGGQKFMSKVLKKVRFTRDLSDPSFLIQVDGGIDQETAPLCIKAGANSLVSGTYLFNAPEMSEAIHLLKGAE